jgi:hypothetical protein
MYLNTATMVAIVIALLSLTGALAYSMYVINLMDKTIMRINIANAHLREQNLRR